MKRCILILALAFIIVFGVFSLGLAFDVKLDAVSWCNDIYFKGTSPGNGVYSLHGYEYGCGYNDRIAHGSIHVTGGVAYFGFTSNSGTSATGDNGSIWTMNVVIDLSSNTGTGTLQGFYESGGVLGSNGGSSNYTMSFGTPDADLPEEPGPDFLAK